MKSAYEIALERLEQRGIDRPSEEALSDETRERMAEVKQKAQAAIAQLEILHRGRLAALEEPAARQEEEQNYLSERGRIEDRRDRDLRKLRES